MCWHVREFMGGCAWTCTGAGVHGPLNVYIGIDRHALACNFSFVFVLAQTCTGIHGHAWAFEFVHGMHGRAKTFIGICGHAFMSAAIHVSA